MIRFLRVRHIPRVYQARRPSLAPGRSTAACIPSDDGRCSDGYPIGGTSNMADLNPRLSRRGLLRLTSLFAASGASAAVIAACGAPAASPTAAPKAAEPAKPAAGDHRRRAAAAPTSRPPPPSRPSRPSRPPRRPPAATPAPAAKGPASPVFEIMTTRRCRRRSRKRRCWPSWSRPASCRRSSSACRGSRSSCKPAGEIGKYGGTWRMGFTGPADDQNMDRHSPRPAALLGRQRPEDRAAHRQGLGGPGRRQDDHASCCARA